MKTLLVAAALAVSLAASAAAAVIAPTITPLARGSQLVSWTFTENDTCSPVELSWAANGSAQIAGTFGGATVLVQGSNDGANYATLNDMGGTAISKLAAALVGIRERTRWVKPSASGGTSQSVTVTILVNSTR